MIYAFDNKQDLHEIFDRDLSDSFSLYMIQDSVNELTMLRRRDVVKWLIGAGITVIRAKREVGDVDSRLLETAKYEGYALLTEDRELASEAVSMGIKTFGIAGRRLNIRN